MIVAKVLYHRPMAACYFWCLAALASALASAAIIFTYQGVKLIEHVKTVSEVVFDVASNSPPVEVNIDSALSFVEIRLPGVRLWQNQSGLLAASQFMLADEFNSTCDRNLAIRPCCVGSISTGGGGQRRKDGICGNMSILNGN